MLTLALGLSYQIKIWFTNLPHKIFLLIIKKLLQHYLFQYFILKWHKMTAIVNSR